MVARNPNDPHRPTVVLVDDDEAVLAALRRLFREDSYEILSTQDPFEAWSWIRTRPVDLVIADEFMPALLGTELLEAVRRNSPWSARVVLTGYPGTTVASRAVQQDVDLVVLKPWD